MTNTRRSHLRKQTVVIATFAVATLGNTATAQVQKKPATPAVIVQTAELKGLKTQNKFTGRIEAINKVKVRARIDGYLAKRDIKEGAEVSQGQLLFELEGKPFEIAVAEAEANLAGAKAALVEATGEFQRKSALQKRQTASKAALDSAKSQMLQAQAAVQLKEAELEKAKLDLGYTKISSPMRGRIGRYTASVGELVSPTSDPLATIVSQNPIYVAFPVPQPLLVKILDTKDGTSAHSVKLVLADGTTYAHDGTIAFAAPEASQSTDTVVVRSKFANPNGYLVDQQLIDVVVIDNNPIKELVISQSGLMLDQQGSYVLAVDEANKVQVKRITVGKQNGPMITVKSGLSAGDRVIVSGQQKVRPGVLVNPQPMRSGLSARAAQLQK